MKDKKSLHVQTRDELQTLELEFWPSKEDAIRKERLKVYERKMKGAVKNVK